MLNKKVLKLIWISEIVFKIFYKSIKIFLNIKSAIDNKK